MNLQMFHKFNANRRAKFVFLFFFLILINPQSFSQGKTYTVVLDAGHGGHDPGNIGYKKYKEKDIALNIVLEVGKILEKQKSIKVIYTRKKDVFVNLWVRGKIANKADADLFVSVHCNAHNTQAFGAETWVLGTSANKKNLEIAKKENEVILLEENYEENYKSFDPNSPESIIGLKLIQEEYLDQSLELATIVQENMVNDLKRKDRGVKQNIFVVLHQTFMPSILVETGFLSNKQEGPYLNSKKVQSKYANSIAEGISKYIKQVEFNSVSNSNSVGDVNVEIEEDARVIRDVVFKVQIASGTNKIETKHYNFKGLRNVERVKVGNSYKYYLGKTSDFNQIKENHKQAKQKGYHSAFIVAFKNGQKISVKDAIKTPQ